MDSGISVYLTRSDGTDFNPRPYTYGLNQTNCYVIDIIMNNMNNNDDSAQPGEEAMLHVYWQGRQLSVSNPAGGLITLGQKGNMTRVDITASLDAGQAPGFPIRIGGEVSINGRKLLRGQDAGYEFRVVREDDSDFEPPAYDSDGLNSAHCYVIDIPVYDEVMNPDGARSGKKAVVRVYRNGNPLTITQPQNGVITLGQPGSVTRINLSVFDPAAPPSTTPTTSPSPPSSGGSPGGGGSPPTTAPSTTTTSSTTTTTVPGGGGGGGTTSTTTVVQPPPETTTSSITTITVKFCVAEQALDMDRQAELDALRAFRDKRLAKTKAGLELIGLYYANSQELVEILETHPDIREKVRALLCELTAILREEGNIGLNSSKYRRVTELAGEIRQYASPALARSIDVVLKRIETEWLR